MEQPVPAGPRDCTPRAPPRKGAHATRSPCGAPVSASGTVAPCGIVQVSASRVSDRGAAQLHEAAAARRPGAHTLCALIAAARHPAADAPRAPDDSCVQGADAAEHVPCGSYFPTTLIRGDGNGGGGCH